MIQRTFSSPEAEMKWKLFEAKRLAKAFSENKCGNCAYWMTSICPKETNVNGYKKGPSMNEIGCSKFEIKPWYEREVEKHEFQIIKYSALLEKNT